MITDLQQVQL